ncbi:MAG: metal ABC transporter substrate-binding protein, partial [Alphaproteobacteria bacterium]|nr:metal ABC transporter substrate-binding protein [Alphaproteobacteria bacterium]
LITAHGTQSIIPHSITTDPVKADMHFWLNPHNAIAFTKAIAVALSDADPAHAEIYAKNAIAQTEQLEALDSYVLQQLGESKRIAHYATYHPAFAYYEHRYNIIKSTNITNTPEAGASVAEARNFFHAIEDGDIECLFKEPQFSPRLFNHALEDYKDKVRLITLDPLGNIYPLQPDLYARMIKDITQAIKTCSTPESGA